MTDVDPATGSALLAAICTQPDEDTPRLEFADWLQEGGNENRAEFVRAQVRRAALKPRPILLPINHDYVKTTDGGHLENLAVRMPPRTKIDIKNHKVFDVLIGNRVSNIRFYGCVLKATRDAYDMDEPVRLLFDVTGERCPVRAECDALEAKTLELWKRTKLWPTARLSAYIPELLTAPNQEHYYKPNVSHAFLKRGFAEEIRCTSEEWLKMADSVAWHPTQTTKFPKCKACGGTEEDERGQWKDKHGHDYWIRCHQCKGKATSPRPCPLTAHPVRTVWITDLPDAHVETVEKQRKWKHPAWLGDLVTDMWRAEWPWIMFRFHALDDARDLGPVNFGPGLHLPDE